MIPSLSDQIIVTMALAAAWFGGEAGRAVLAGAAGGFVRWLIADRRRIRDGMAAVLVGAIMARYATPIVLTVLESTFGGLKGDVRGTAGFAAGLAGMSLAKLLMGMFEARAKRVTDSCDGGGPNA